MPRLLLFIRHAIAVPAEDFAGPDAERPLTSKGIRKAREVLRETARLYKPTRVISSPNLRAVETAQLLLDAIGPEAPSLVRTDALLPEAGTAAWLSFLAQAEPPLTDTDIVAVVGHEPSLGRLFARHLGIEAPLPFKKAGIGVARVPNSGDLTACELVAFIPPKVWRKR